MQNNPQNNQKPGLSWSTPAAPAKPAAPAPVQNNQPMQKALPVGMSQSSMAGYIGMLVGGIVIGVLLAWGYSALRSPSSPTATATTTSNSTTVATTNASGDTGAAANLELAATQRAGMSVAIDSVKVTKPTWVVVYDNVNGKQGNTLGAHLFSTSGSGTVTLLRATKAGTEYFVGMRVDNGDGKYTRANDAAVTGANGQELVVTFKAQ